MAYLVRDPQSFLVMLILFVLAFVVAYALYTHKGIDLSGKRCPKCGSRLGRFDSRLVDAEDTDVLFGKNHQAVLCKHVQSVWA